MAALGITEAPSFPEGTVFGYRLGPVQPGSVEASAHRRFGGEDGVLTLAQAVLHRVSSDVEAFFPGSGFILRPTAEGGGQLEAGSDQEAFCALYAKYVVAVLSTWGASRGHAPDSKAVAEQLARLLLERGLSDAGIVEALQRDPEPMNRRLGQRVYRRLQALAG
jgi:hypothetical protein